MRKPSQCNTNVFFRAENIPPSERPPSNHRRRSRCLPRGARHGLATLNSPVGCLFSQVDRFPKLVRKRDVQRKNERKHAQVSRFLPSAAGGLIMKGRQALLFTSDTEFESVARQALPGTDTGRLHRL